MARKNKKLNRKKAKQNKALRKKLQKSWDRQELMLREQARIRRIEAELDKEGFTLDKPVMDSGQVAQHYNGYLSKKRTPSWDNMGNHGKIGSYLKRLRKT